MSSKEDNIEQTAEVVLIRFKLNWLKLFWTKNEDEALALPLSTCSETRQRGFKHFPRSAQTGRELKVHPPPMSKYLGCHALLNFYFFCLQSPTFKCKCTYCKTTVKLQLRTKKASPVYCRYFKYSSILETDINKHLKTINYHFRVFLNHPIL